MTWIRVVVSALPAVLAVIPGLPRTLVPIIVDGIAEAEHLPGSSGPEKRAHVTELVKVGIDGINAARGTTVIDPSTVMPTVEHAIDLGVSIANQVFHGNGKHPQ